MKISTIIESLTNILKEHGDLDAIYSEDDEGNSYNEVYFEPSIGTYFENEFKGTELDELPNVVCIN